MIKTEFGRIKRPGAKRATVIRDPSLPLWKLKQLKKQGITPEDYYKSIGVKP